MQQDYVRMRVRCEDVYLALANPRPHRQSRLRQASVDSSACVFVDHTHMCLHAEFVCGLWSVTTQGGS